MTKITSVTDHSTLFIASTEGEALRQNLHSFPLSGCHFRLATCEKWGGSFALESTSVPGVVHQIACFKNEHEAVSALHQINKTLARRRSFNRLKSQLRNVFWPGAFLTATLVGIVSLNGAVMNIGAAGGPASTVQQQTSLPATGIQQIAQPASPEGAMLQTPSQVSADDLASLKAAVGNGRFTVTLSQGHARTLYVFSDPRCPHCRDLEPRLEQLSKIYNVEIFPVSAFGQERSHAITTSVLNTDKKARSEKWTSAFNGGDYQALDEKIQNDGQSTGSMLADANDAAFVKFGFIGTPTIVTDEGKTVPVSAVRHDTQLQQYMGNK